MSVCGEIVNTKERRTLFWVRAARCAAMTAARALGPCVSTNQKYRNNKQEVGWRPTDELQQAEHQWKSTSSPSPHPLKQLHLVLNGPLLVPQYLEICLDLFLQKPHRAKMLMGAVGIWYFIRLLFLRCSNPYMCISLEEAAFLGVTAISI